MEKQPSTIVTFYSYKGGVGRSMALANVAYILAQTYGKKVLVIDWDLEAPGLHRFFGVADEDIRHGLLDMLYDYKQILREATASLPEEIIKVKRYIDRVPSYSGNGSISILTAGRQDATYASRVNEFDWKEFYEKWYGYGFMENFKKQVKGLADIILLDSRTGVTDIGGICTLQLPDIVVLLFALNEQNIAGVRKIADKILEKAPNVTERQPPKLILRASRVERYLEEDKLKEWQQKAAERLQNLLTEADQREPVRFIAKKNIPYVGAYAFGEIPLSVPNSPLNELTAAFEDLTQSLLEATTLAEAKTPAAPRRQRWRQLIDQGRALLLSRRFLMTAGSVLLVLSIILLALIIIYSKRNAQYAAFLEQQQEASLNTLIQDNKELTDKLNQVTQDRDRLQKLVDKPSPTSLNSAMTAIVLNVATKLADAQAAMAQASNHTGNGKVAIYHAGRTFRLLALYPSAADAAGWLDFVKNNINPKAYQTNLNQWCRNPVPQNGYTDCPSASVGNHPPAVDNSNTPSHPGAKKHKRGSRSAANKNM